MPSLSACACETRGGPVEAMFDVTSLAARGALINVADWGQRLPSQVPMPSPNAANNPMAAKKAQNKAGDLAQKLARSRSQEF